MYNPKKVSRIIFFFYLLAIILLIIKSYTGENLFLYLVFAAFLGVIIYEFKVYITLKGMVENLENPKLLDNVIGNAQRQEVLINELNKNIRKHFLGIIRKSILLILITLFMLKFMFELF